MIYRAFRRRVFRNRFRDTPFEKLYLSPHPTEKVSVDCELSDMHPASAELLSIGAVIVKGNSVLTSRSFVRTLKTARTVPGASIKIHGLRNEDLKKGRDLKGCLEELAGFVENRPWIGFYVKMDEAVISRHLKGLFGVELLQPRIEVSEIFHRAYGNRFSGRGDLHFENVVKTLGIPVFGRHTAIGDAVVTALAYLALSRKN